MRQVHQALLKIGLLSVGQRLRASLHSEQDGISILFCGQAEGDCRTKVSKNWCFCHQMIHLTLLRWIDPEDIVLQALTRSTRRPRTKCSLNGRVLRIVLVPVRNLNVVWDSAAKGANRAEGVCLLSMRRPMLSLKRDSVVVVDSLSAGFVMSVTSDVALALCSDGVGSILIVLALGVWSGSTKVTTGSLIPLATGSFSVVRDSTTVTFSLSIALETLFVMSSLEKPRRVTSSSWESAQNKLVSAFQFEVLFALVPSLASWPCPL